MSQTRFTQLVEKTRGLNDAQKSALKGSFQTVSSELRRQGRAERTGEEFARVLGGALTELDEGAKVPPQAQIPGDPAAQGQGQQAQGQGQGQAAGQSNDPLKAIQDQLKQLTEAKDDRLSRAREALAGRDRKGREGEEKNGQGQGGQGQGQGQGQQAGGQGGGQGGGSGGGNDGGNALSQLSKALGKNNNNQQNNFGGGSSQAPQPQQNQNDRDRDRNNNNSRGVAKSGSSALDGLSSTSSSSESEEKKKKDSSKEESNPLMDALNAAKKDTGPQQYVPKGSVKLGSKSTLSPLQGGLSGNFGGGFDPGFGGGLGQGAGPQQLGGAPIMGGGAGAGLASGGDLSGMRFDSDSFAGPSMGLPKFNSGPIYGEGGSGAASSDSGNGLEGELASSAGSYSPEPVRLGSIPNSQQIDLHRGELAKGSILDKYFGKVVRTACQEASTNQVAVCYHPRAKGKWQNFRMGLM